MAFSLYAATIPSFRQVLGAMGGLIDKAQAFCVEKALDPAEIIQARLAPDMLPFAYQMKATTVHSIGALEGAEKGLFSPDRSTPPDSFAGLKQHLSDADATLAMITPADVNRLEGRDMRFSIGEFHMDFVAEDFLMSFSLPNFYFHATTAYDILRAKGLQLSKRDFGGRWRVKA